MEQHQVQIAFYTQCTFITSSPLPNAVQFNELVGSTAKFFLKHVYILALFQFSNGVTLVQDYRTHFWKFKQCDILAVDDDSTMENIGKWCVFMQHFAEMLSALEWVECASTPLRFSTQLITSVENGESKNYLLDDLWFHCRLFGTSSFTVLGLVLNLQGSFLFCAKWLTLHELI